MLCIQNKGNTETLLTNNNNINNNQYNNSIKWDAKYNGENANIHLNVNDNGTNEYIHMSLNRNDIDQLLGIQPIEIPLEKRLLNDFLSPSPMVYPVTLNDNLYNNANIYMYKFQPINKKKTYKQTHSFQPYEIVSPIQKRRRRIQTKKHIKPRPFSHSKTLSMSSQPNHRSNRTFTFRPSTLNF